MLLASVPSAVAAPGDPDPTFSGDGKQSTDFGGRDFGNAVALQADGKIVVAGSAQFVGSPQSLREDFAVARYNVDGTLDSSFSGDGKQTIDFGAEGDNLDSARAVAIQDDGKIVLAGEDNESATVFDFAVARLNADGTLDSSFSGDGKQTIDFGGSRDSGRAVAVQGDGKIVLAGSSAQGTSDEDFAVARFNVDGTLDGSFSGDGKLTTEFTGSASGPERGAAVALQPDGKIVVGGESGFDFAVARYSADGTLDSSFSGDGKQTTDFGDDQEGQGDAGRGIAVQADGKIVVVGSADTSDSPGLDVALARFNVDGTLDSSFSGDGKQTTDFGGNLESARAVAIQADGKIVLAGDSVQFGGTGADYSAVARFNVDGTLDSSFSEGGKQTTNFFPSSVAIQADGKIVVAGSSNQDFAVARYEGGSGATDTTPPQTTITSGPTGTTADSTPTFAFSSSESGSSFECRVDSSAFAPCSSPHTTGALADGAHTFQVRATDAAGNVDQSPASRSFTVATGGGDPPPDADGDGVPDGSDACPDVAGTSANGCPPSGGGDPGGGDDAGGGGNPEGGGAPGGGGAPDGGGEAGGGDGDAPGGDSPGGGTDDDPPTARPSIGGPRSAGGVRVSPNGSFIVRKQFVDCTGGGPNCRVRTRLTGRVRKTRRRGSATIAAESRTHRTKARAKRRAVRLGGSSFKVEAGEKGKVTIKLSRRGLKLLKRLKRIKTEVRIVLRRGAIKRRKTVRVTLKAPRRSGRRPASRRRARGGAKSSSPGQSPEDGVGRDPVRAAAPTGRPRLSGAGRAAPRLRPRHMRGRRDPSRPPSRRRAASSPPSSDCERRARCPRRRSGAGPPRRRPPPA